MPLRACIVCGALSQAARCPKHPGRPKNAHWSKNRNRAAQAAFRRAVLKRDGFQCMALDDGVRCPRKQGLHAHHLRPGYDPKDGITLCNEHHRAVDAHAR